MANHTFRNVAPGLRPTETSPTNNPLRFTKEEIRRVFERYDSNKDGKLDWKELRKAFKLGLGSKCGFARARLALRHVGKNGDGSISLTQENMDKLVEYAFSCGYSNC